MGARDGDDVVFQRLAHHFQGPLGELGQLVEKEDAAARQADLARAWDVAAANKPGMTDRVMRRSERPMLDQWCPARKLVGHRVHARDVQGLVDGHARQDRGQRAGQQRLAGARRPGHEDVRADRRSLLCSHNPCLLDDSAIEGEDALVL